MKCLIYVTKTKPYLYDLYKDINGSLYVTSNLKSFKDKDYILNGKIVAEFGGEAEDLFLHYNYSMNNLFMRSKTMNKEQLLKDSCLTQEDFEEYMPNYAIHIKNLEIFDKPKKLGMAHYTTLKSAHKIQKAPQNMCIVRSYYPENYFEKYVLISIRPEWACKILNGEKTIEVRKKVLKEML